MTALAGFVSFAGGGDPAQRCERMLRSQQVHAPDPSRIWADGPAAVGRRLYKLLPEDLFDLGPVVSADGRWVLAADVRLDNRDELRADLGLTGDEASRLADSAILMQALEQDDGQKLGGKSAEASRFILRAIDRELDQA